MDAMPVLGMFDRRKADWMLGKKPAKPLRDDQQNIVVIAGEAVTSAHIAEFVKRGMLNRAFLAMTDQLGMVA